MKIFGWLGSPTAGRIRRTRIACAVLVPALVLAGCATYAVLETAAERAPAVVDRGPVGTTLTGTGNLVAITELRLGFPTTGELNELLVKVGDRVEAGQILARQDDFELRQILEQREADLDAEEAELDRIENGNSVDNAQSDVDQAKEIYWATVNQVDATNDANEAAVDRAERTLANAREQLREAERELDDDETLCANPTTAGDEAPVLANVYENGDPGDQTTPPDADTCAQILADDRAAVRAAEAAVVAAQNAVGAAEDTVETGRAGGELSIDNAEQSVVSAQNELDDAENDDPADVAVQQAVVDSAEASVRLAEHDLEQTELIAPTSGVVASINGNVGEFVAGTGTTPLAPGTTAPLPEVNEQSPPGGGAFIVLDDVDTFQMVVSFNEGDAVKISPNQDVEVTVPAVPGLTIPGTVLAVAPTGRDVADVIQFAVTVVLAHGDPQLRDAMTAEASIYVDGADNVLRVPSAAVIRQDDGSTAVRVPGEAGGEPVVVPFEAGLVGTEFTEVRSGLEEGQVVLVP